MLLSCLGKLFTAIINDRLNKYAEKYDLIGWTQTGFRKNYSTTYNLFILKCLMDIMQANKKKYFVVLLTLSKRLKQFGGGGGFM